MRVDRSDHPLLQPDNGGHAEQPPLQEEKWRRKLRRRPLAARRRPRRSGKGRPGVFSGHPLFLYEARRRSRRARGGRRGEGIRQQPGRVPGGSSPVLARMTRSHTHTDERGDSHGKESSQGREEEGGRKEAVRADPFSVGREGLRPRFLYAYCTPSQTRTRRTTSHCRNCSTISIPLITCPKTVYRPSRCGCGP